VKVNEELKLSAIILAGSAYMWFYAIPNHIRGFKPSLLPNCLVVALAILGVVFLVQGVRLYRSGVRQQTFSFLNESAARSLVIVPMAILYVFLIEQVGFYSMTVVFMIVFTVYFGVRRPLALGVFSTLTPAVIYLIIGKILSFPFPAGIAF
jgi:putative tricarboxylic transport membrane protein